MISLGERSFHLVLGTIVIILLILVSYDVKELSRTRIFPKSNICVSEQCTKVNNLLKSYVDKTKDPCKDFEKFVCSLYVQKKEKEGTYGSGLGDGTAVGVMELSQMIKKPIGNQDRFIIKLAKKFYQACMDKENVNSKGMKMVQKQMQKLPYIPILDPRFTSRGFSWINFYRVCVNLGIEIYALVYISFGLERGNEKDIFIQINRGYVPKLSDEARTLRRNLVLRHMEANNIRKTAARVRDLDKALDFHQELAGIMNDEVEETSGKKSIAHLKKSCPDLDWLALANILRDKHNKLKEKDYVIVINEKVVCDIQKKIKNRNREVANHLYLNLLFQLATTLNNFEKANDPGNNNDQRSLACTDVTLTSFPVGSSILYMLNKDAEYGQGARRELNRLISNEVREELKIMVGNEATWISKNTRQKLLEKIDKAVFHLGFLKSNETISQQIPFYENAYKSINFLLKDPLNNVLQVIQVRNKAIMKANTITFPLRVLADAALANAVIANAWYSPNNLLLTYAILSPLSYQHLGPASHNYGGITYVGGHEFGHSLDPSFYVFDINNVISDFWDKRGEQEYKRRIKCLVEEYKKAHDDCADMNVDGELTLSENFADLVGLTVARRLFSKWLKKNGGVDLKLKDFSEYTPEQMFWIATSLIFCERSPKEACVKWHKEDPHTIGPVRINMNAKMSPYFAKDWKCDSGPMVYKNKCKVF